MEQNIITPEQQADIDARVAAFKERHLANVQEFMCDFVTFPQYVQIGPDVFGTHNSMHIVDKKYAAVPSPLQAEEVAEGMVDDDESVIDEG